MLNMPTKRQLILVVSVCRDMLSSFWQEAFVVSFDGRNAVVPSIHPHTKMDLFVTLDTILSHGYLPVRIAFPTIGAAIFGTHVYIPDDIMVKSFQCYLSFHDSCVLEEALQLQSFSNDMVSSILAQFGCRQIPQPANLKRIVVQLAQHEFITKPLGAVQALYSGIPKCHYDLWRKFVIEQFFTLYNILSATPQAVLKKLIEPSPMKADEQRVFNYLTSSIGNLSQEMLQCFLRFVTGSSSMMANQISISFNKLTGIARRPISHTCSCVLELSTEYLSYLDFSGDFNHVLTSNESWNMDAV